VPIAPRTGTFGKLGPFSTGECAVAAVAIGLWGITTNIKKTLMKKRNIIITAPDHARLSDMIAFGHMSPREHAGVHALEAELARAEIVAPETVPPDVITMNSRARMLDLDTGEHMDFTLVFPDEVDLAEGKISVLAPVGTGMLGYRVGDSFELGAPNGKRRLKVINVTFQPEAALAISV
jgi:regulator of nucleoside diphosphate kinase